MIEQNDLPDELLPKPATPDPDQKVLVGIEPEQLSLLDVPPDWQKEWKGMPEFRQEDQTPWASIPVHFKSREDRNRFAAIVGQKITDDTRSIWFPKAEIRRYADKKYTAETAALPRYPIYIPSKGRFESRLTVKALDKMSVPYFVVVEGHEFEKYAAFVPRERLLVLPWSKPESQTELVPARNWIMEHLIANGFARHWQIDDNIKAFYRLHDNLKVPVGTGNVFRAAEDFVDRYENVAQAGFQYFMFASRKTVLPAFTLNTRIYSCTLNNNAIPFRYRGVYNDDTDISIRALKAGWCTVLFNAFLAEKSVTMTVKGGNTPIYQGDGRLRMAESLRDQHPDVVTITEKWGRWQHQVDYGPFKRNALKLRDGVVAPAEADNYGMSLETLDPTKGEALPEPPPEEAPPQAFAIPEPREYGQEG